MSQLLSAQSSPVRLLSGTSAADQMVGHQQTQNRQRQQDGGVQNGAGVVGVVVGVGRGRRGAYPLVKGKVTVGGVPDVNIRSTA